MIAATPQTDEADLTAFLDKLSKYVREFDDVNARSASSMVCRLHPCNSSAASDILNPQDFVVKQFGYDRTDVQSWLATVGYPEDVREVKSEMIMKVLETLETAGVVKTPADGWKIDQFVRKEVAKLV